MYVCRGALFVDMCVACAHVGQSCPAPYLSTMFLWVRGFHRIWTRLAASTSQWCMHVSLPPTLLGSQVCAVTSRYLLGCSESKFRVSACVALLPTDHLSRASLISNSRDGARPLGDSAAPFSYTPVPSHSKQQGKCPKQDWRDISTGKNIYCS